MTTVEEETERKKRQHRDRINGRIPPTVSQYVKDRKYLEYVTQTAKKTIKRDDKLIHFIVKTGISAYTSKPIHLAILGETSEGKTYPVVEILKLFPKEDVIFIGRASPTAFIRDRGILVDQDSNSVEEKIEELEEKLDNSVITDEDKKTIREQIRDIKREARTMIDLRNKIIVFLEPPQEDTWNNFKSILSQDLGDDGEIDFRFTNHTQTTGHQTKKVFVKGCPAFIFCSAKDHSKLDSWPEIQSRFFVVSPNSSKTKYSESIKLKSKMQLQPKDYQKRFILSDEEVKIAKNCILWLKYNIQVLREKDDEKKIYFWLPFERLVSDHLPSDKGTDMRDAGRVYELVKIEALSHLPHRHVLFLYGNPSVIPDISDVRQALVLTQTSNGLPPHKIPQHKIKFFTDLFLPCYKKKVEKNQLDSKYVGVYNETIYEERIAVTTNDLVKWNQDNKVISKGLTTDTVKKTYLDELTTAGLIGQQDSRLKQNTYIYYPLIELNKVVETSKNEPFDDSLQQSDPLFEIITKNLTKTYTFLQIMTYWRRRRNGYQHLTPKQYFEDDDIFYILGKEERVEEELEQLYKLREQAENNQLLERKKQQYVAMIERARNRNDSIAANELEEELKEIQAQILDIPSLEEIDKQIEELQEKQFDVYDSDNFNGRSQVSISDFLEEYHRPLTSKVAVNFVDVKRSSNNAPFDQQSSKNVEMTDLRRLFDVSTSNMKTNTEGA